MLNTMYYNWMTGANMNHQPDVTIAVGNTQQAVKFLAHKCVLSRYSGYFKALFSSYSEDEKYISNIGSHTFAYLLSFMYTGHLELNPLNVYEVFLASNLLHINEALDLCKQYFIHKQQNYTEASFTLPLSPVVVKPIPRHNTAATLPIDNQKPHQILKYQPLRLHNEPCSMFKPLRSSEASHHHHHHHHHHNNHQHQHQFDSKEEDEEKDDGHVNIGDEEDGNCGAEMQTENNGTSDSKPSAAPQNKVILDIACCDGPIKFHRITNQHYDPQKEMLAATIPKDIFSPEKTTSFHGCKHVFKNDIQLQPGITDEYQFPKSSDAPHHVHNVRQSSIVSNVDVKYKKKFENLQCYPCKTCGSKFPSYYFVHKHRKLHHQDAKEFVD